MAARFGAKIVPFGAVGEDDLGQVSVGLFLNHSFFLYEVLKTACIRESVIYYFSRKQNSNELLIYKLLSVKFRI